MSKRVQTAVNFTGFAVVPALIFIAMTFIVFKYIVAGAPAFFYPGEFFYDTQAKPEAGANTEHNRLQRIADASKAGILPSQIYIEAPFSSQAPFLNWIDPYSEACEESSVAMAMAWAFHEDLAPSSVNDAILGMIAYENFYFGYNHDTALRETAKLLTGYYGYENTRLRYDISINDIKAELALGRIIIVPLAGELLANPYYLSPPLYHMLVIKGYDDISKEFITNDPGTKRGESYRYPYNILWDAIHDWTGEDATLLGGRKGMIVVEPQARRKNQ